MSDRSTLPSKPQPLRVRVARSIQPRLLGPVLIGASSISLDPIPWAAWGESRSGGATASILSCCYDLANVVAAMLQGR